MLKQILLVASFLSACMLTAHAADTTAASPAPTAPAPGVASGAGDDTETTRQPRVDLFDSGKLLATGGVTQVEGAGGGGLVPWALITGYGTRNAIGASAHYTFVDVPNYQLHTFGASIGLYDRVELSYERMVFNTGETGAALGLGKGFTFDEDVFGAKVRLFGDAVYGQDSWLPQVAAGIQYKINDRANIIRAVGARDPQGVDFYLSATKILLGESLLLDGTLRMTRANQLGLLGFGGDRHNGYQPEFEGSAAYLVTRQVAVGAEYRTKPNNLRFAHESDWFDVFVAYFFNKHVSATLAFVDLGSIAGRKNQDGVYFSLQGDSEMRRRDLLAPLAGAALIGCVRPAAASLYDDLGGQQGMARLADSLLRIALADDRIRAVFDDVNIERLKGKLAEQFCQVSDGPCRYSGVSMKGAHRGLSITDADFNALVEDLELAMDQAGISTWTQNRFLARLAPMRSDVVTR